MGPRICHSGLPEAENTCDLNPTDWGPMNEYDSRVSSGQLRDDEHQRGIVQSLQHLHDELKEYHAPVVVHPDIELLKPPRRSFLSSLFQRSHAKHTTQIPDHVPKGLYMFGDVGSGKTMLMDMFYDTLPRVITSKTRIHFHNFMQDVHKRLHAQKLAHGNDFDAVPFVAADLAEKGSVLCFDEFQCTDVADAMILRRFVFRTLCRFSYFAQVSNPETDGMSRLLESLMSHGVILVTTSNRHPNDLYKNGIQRDSFIPCITLLKTSLHVLNLDSHTDYRKIPRPPSGVYHAPLDKAANTHAEKWFRFLGDFDQDPPHRAQHMIWGRKIEVPKASGTAAMFTFDELIGRPTGAADYLELMRSYESFIVTGVPGMTFRERDLARRFITFIDAVYESRAKLVLTTAVPLARLFMSRPELEEALQEGQKLKPKHLDEGADVEDAMRSLMDDLGMNMKMLKNSSIFSGDEERFAFARALSRLSEMGSQEWVERGMGLERSGGKAEKDSWQRVRSRWREDSL
ncbi:MAG: hypothetical protein M1825_005999 [Sarcosagium campestre]|nr:MAG: hypothetical protein M1825_005999 [Sarcosagium campestre]